MRMGTSMYVYMVEDRMRVKQAWKSAWMSMRRKKPE